VGMDSARTPDEAPLPAGGAGPEPAPGEDPGARDADLGPLFGPAGSGPAGGPGPGPLAFPAPAAEPSDRLPDRAALDRYLRLTGATILPRGGRDPLRGGDAPAWIEGLSNGRFLVCELGLRWHLARTQAEARGLVEQLRRLEVNPDTITRQWMDERAELFRAHPTPGTLALRALLEGMGLEFREQAVLGWRMADFLVAERVVLELDGPVRRARKSRMDGRCRDLDLVRSGFLVHRVDEQELLDSPGAVQRELGALLDDAFLTGTEPPTLELPSPGSVERPVISIYTDGGCSPNPGRGGYGVILAAEGRQKELSGGFLETSNNRMELLAAIVGLEALKRPGSVVTLFSDSRYLVDGITKGWARKWKRNGWMRTPEEPARNADLWARLLDLCARHKVTFEWVRGHGGHLENERCDQLAGAALKRADLPADPGYRPKG